MGAFLEDVFLFFLNLPYMIQVFSYECDVFYSFFLFGFFPIPVQFYDKFNIRHNIAELLEYLWQVPSHRNAWRQVIHSHAL